MSLIIERMYSPSEKDILGGLNQARFAEQFSNLNAASTQLSQLGSIVPLNTVRIVMGVSFTALPGAAQFCTGMFARAVEAAASANNYATIYMQAGSNTVAVRTYGVAELGGMILMPGEQLAYTVNFNAGAAANSAEVSAWGYQFPRANIQFS